MHMSTCMCMLSSEAYLDALMLYFLRPTGTKLFVRFDPQPTNRAGMNGLAPCTFVGAPRVTLPLVFD